MMVITARVLRNIFTWSGEPAATVARQHILTRRGYFFVSSRATSLPIWPVLEASSHAATIIRLGAYLLQLGSRV